MSRERIPAVQPEAERALLDRFGRLDRRLVALEATPLEQPLLTGDFIAREEQTLFVEAPSAGIAGLLPAPRQQNRGARILLAFLNQNAVTLTCAGGTVNGFASVTNRSVGCYLAVCDGVNGWLIRPSREKASIKTEAAGASNNNYALTDDTSILFVTASATFTGFARPSGNVDGDEFYLQCDAGVTATIPFNSGSSSAGNRVAGVYAQGLVLPSRSLTKFVYRSLLWRAQLSGVDPFFHGLETNSLATPFQIRVPFSAAAAGTADDVTIYNAAAPFGFRITDCHVKISTAIGGSTVQLRSASGGGGSALSSALSSAATGTARNNDTDSRSVSSGGSLFLRRSDRGVAGEITINCNRT